MDNQKQSVIDRLKQANNILVTVSSNPSVDQLAACIGLTLALNKTGKHATAVFSGAIPSTIEFLQPEQTIEKNTDSLRDFIIALDKSKADKLRYKVEDRVVKIFITPYRTSISDKDLDFSQGDFNVDVVLALGVHVQQDLDQAITAHGRILHDATVMSVNVTEGAPLGTISWVNPHASSLAELAVQISDGLDRKLIDGQIATAFLTGIVAETERFSNQKTSPQTMSISAELMAAGANQQLVASEIEKPIAQPQRPIAHEEPSKPAEEGKDEAPKPRDDGTIEIPHDNSDANKPGPIALPPVPEPPKHEDEQQSQEQPEEKIAEEAPKEAEFKLPEPEAPEKLAEEPVKQEEPEEPELPPLPPQPEAPQIHIDREGRLRPLDNMNSDSSDVLPPPMQPADIRHDDSSHLLVEPPVIGTSPLTANAQPESYEPSMDPLSAPQPATQEPLLSREPLLSPAEPNHDAPQPEGQASMPTAPVEPATPAAAPLDTANTFAQPTPQIPIIPPSPSFQPQASETLDAIEHDVNSPHLAPAAEPFAAPAPVVVSPTVAPTPPAAAASDAAAPTPMNAFQTAAADNGQEPPAVAPQIIAPSSPLPGAEVSNARDLVQQAIDSASQDHLEPVQALNAQPVNLDLHHEPMLPPQPPTSAEQSLPEPSLNYGQQQAQPLTPPQPQFPNPDGQQAQPGMPGQTPPPASPPPMMPFNPGQ